MNRWSLLGLAALAMVVSAIPVVSWPFMWLETFFHELSHGLMAMLTGGKISHIELHLRGSGLCYTQGGIRFLISFAGYAGSVLWGVMIFQVASALNRRNAVILSAVLTVITGLAVVLWMRDLVSILIGSGLTVLFALGVKWGDSILLKPFLQFCGLFVLLDAVRSPLHQIWSFSSDSQTLASLTFIPGVVWIGVWVVIGLAGLATVWRAAGRAPSPHPSPSTDRPV